MIGFDYDELSFDYAIENAINELFNNLKISNYKYHNLQNANYLNESQIYTQVLILNEGVKDAIMNFLKKVTEAVSKAWTVFKERRVKNEIKELIQKAKGKLNEGFKMLMPKEFDLPELKIWQDMYETIVVKDFMTNYETWKQSNVLKSEEDFIKSQYPSLVEEGKSIYDVMYSKVFKKVNSNEALDYELFKQYVEYLENFNVQVDTISKDIDALNASNKNIETKLNQIINASATYVGYDILSILFEAPGDNTSNNTNSNEESKFRSADPNDSKEKDNDDKMVQDRKNIIIYYKASTKIFSAKLKICNRTRLQSEKICKNYINLQSKGKKENTEIKQVETKSEDQNASTTIQK